MVPAVSTTRPFGCVTAAVPPRLRCQAHPLSDVSVIAISASVELTPTWERAGLVRFPPLKFAATTSAPDGNSEMTVDSTEAPEPPIRRFAEMLAELGTPSTLIRTVSLVPSFDTAYALDVAVDVPLDPRTNVDSPFVELTSMAAVNPMP